MLTFREVQPHGDIKQVFQNVYMVTGTNYHEGAGIQASRNMIIVREKTQSGNELTLINTVRLDEKGLAALNQLGQVKNIVRIGAFHGYDDAFYLNEYDASLWAIEGMVHSSGHKTDKVLRNNTDMPFRDCELFRFETSKHPEGMLVLHHPEGSILITCDSIQNWTHQDEFTSDHTFTLFKEQGLIKIANFPSTWMEACDPQPIELEKIKTLRFQHLLSAHGEPLKDHAYEEVCNTLKQKFNI